MQGFDWYKYAVGGAASREDSFSRLNPDYATRVAQLVQAADQELGPRALTITSAYRSPELQAKLFKDAVAKYGSEKAARKWVAPPGKSKHNSGMAVDFADASGKMLRDPNSREAQWIKANASRFGLDVPMSWEPWQVELAGSRGGPGPDVAAGGGNATLAGGGMGDDLADLDAFMGYAPPAAAQEPPPVTIMPQSTLAQDYASGGAQMGGLSDLDAFMGYAPAPIAQAPAPVAAPVQQEGGVMRGLGLGARSVAEGLASTAGIIYDPIAATQNYLFGTEVPPLAQQVSGALTGMGVPSPQNSQERVLAAIQSGAAGSIGGVGAGRAIGGGVGSALAANPIDQVVSGGAAVGAAQLAAENDAGIVGQLGAGLLGGVAGSAAVSGAGRAMGVAPEAMGGTARVEPPVTRPQPPGPNMQDVQTLLVTAQRRGPSSRQAMRDLARIAKVDPEAAAAAERLGIDLPIDVFTTDLSVREAAGAIRGIKGGAATDDFLKSVEAAQGKATEAMATLDNNTSIADVSENVMSSLRQTQEGLKASASELYNAVDAKVPKSTPVETPSTAAILSGTMEDLGGMSRMSPQEQMLVKAITNPDEPLTYAGLVRLKQDVGRALERGQGPYADVNQGTLKRLYGGLADDQISAVESIGGSDLRKGLEAANNLTAQRKDLEKSIVGAFGKDLEGSIASKLRNSVTQASKGDLGNMNRILNVIPPELQREAVAAAIGDLAKVRTGSNPGAFSFEGFAKTYQGMRSNPPVYNKIVGVLGKDGHALMEDLYRVSAAVSRARAAIPMTGKANQIMQSGALGAEGIIARVLNSTGGKTAVRATTTGAFGVMGGVPAAIAADSVGAALTMGRPDRVQAAGKLLASDEFKQIAIEAATKPAISPATRRKVLASQAMRNFAKAAKIDNPETWLNAVISGNITMSQSETQE